MAKAITSFSELKTAVSSYVVRSDTGTYVEDWIAFAESRLRRDLRCRQMEAETDITVDAETETLPDGFISVSYIYVAGSPNKALKATTAQTIKSINAGSQTGKPIMYATTASSIMFAPTPDTSYTVTMGYYALDALTSSNTTNAILDDFPQLYLYATLAEAYRWIRDTNNAQYFDQLAGQMIDDINRADNADRFGSQPILIRPDGVAV